MTKIGIVLASHVPELARGVYQLLKQSASDVPITYAGGTDDDKIGSSFDKINDAITSNPADELFAFYDLGSAKMTLEMAIEMSDKRIKLFDAAFVEGAYTAASLAQGSSSKDAIEEQVAALKIK